MYKYMHAMSAYIVFILIRPFHSHTDTHAQAYVDSVIYQRNNCESDRNDNSPPRI